MASMLSGVMGKIEGLGNTVALKGKQLIDGIFPPEKRAQVLAWIKSFAMKNPKLSAFLLTNFALTGPPLIVFGLFTLTVFIFSLLAALIIGLLVAVAFTLFAVGTALLILFPAVFFTTLVASFIFLWGLGGYYLIKWFNKDNNPAEPGKALGDTMNSLTGGRLDFLMDGARADQASGVLNPKKPEKVDKGESEKKENGTANGTPKAAPKKATTNGTPTKSPPGAGDAKKHVEGATNGVKKNMNTDSATKATDKVTKTANVDGVQGKAANATGTVKGTLGGATGLA